MGQSGVMVAMECWGGVRSPVAISEGKEVPARSLNLAYHEQAQTKMAQGEQQLFALGQIWWEVLEE